MEGKRLIHKIKLQNILSFGDDGIEIDLEPLNVLIGTNSSGKSNFVECLSIFAATPTNLTGPFRKGGGIREWLWKGTLQEPEATIEVVIEPDKLQYKDGYRYSLSFTAVSHRLEIIREVIENLDFSLFHYKNENGHPKIHSRISLLSKSKQDSKSDERHLKPEDINLEQSIFSQIKDMHYYPEITYIGKQFGDMAFFREWNLGKDTQIRLPQPADLESNFLTPDLRNLPLILNNLICEPYLKKIILENLRILSSSVIDISTKVIGGTIQIYFHEEGLKHSIPSTRFSDGTLRFLSLLAILCHPSPPPLICIEEPELGLHPDILPTIAKLLIEASKKTQLVVTTHSDILVSSLSEIPESVIICEKENGRTSLQRLEKEKLKDWLKDYPLGELWIKGELGGTRW